MNSYYDPIVGRWICPEDGFIGNTGASLKTVIASLASGEPDLVAVDQLLYDYFYIVRHGRTSHTGNKIEWTLNESATGKITVTYKDGSEWFDEIYTDELPKWLLLSILRAIGRHRPPLGDLQAEQLTKRIRDSEAAYVQKKQQESSLGIRLNTSRFSEEDSDE